MLFTSVVYDRAIQYKHQQEIQINHVFADRLLQSISKQKSEHEIRQILTENIAIESYYADIFAILDKERNSIQFFAKKSFNTEIFNDLLSEIKNNKENEGQLINENRSYYWFIKDIAAFKNDNQTLLIISPLSSSAVSGFTKFFGLPFIISGFILCWVMVWASIILSSLVEKLQNQKQTLSDQATDIEKARDEALYANTAKSNFLANMSHEIRTPLTAIIGFAESCQDIDQSMEERSNANKTIIKSSKHLMHIINEILDLSKIEAGKLEIEAIPISVMEVLDEIDPLISIMAEEKGLTFRINYTYPLPERIISDQVRLKQILINLCSNAIKFTNKGHVDLNVSYKTESSSLIFEVIDTGIGLSEEQKEKIFKPFEQADSSTTRKFGGTGLGLTLSRQLAEMLNGELYVESAVNKGSCFTVKLDIVEAENSSHINERAYKNTAEKVNELNIETPKLNGKILLAEDNEDIQELVKLLMKKVGVDLDIVGNGQQAVKAAIESEYDLVFMDIQMPVMDGLTAMQELQKQEYNQPVVAMTANAMQKDRDECKEAGFSSFISKPINRSDLYLVLMQYLKPSKTSESKKTLLTSDLLNDEPDLIDLLDNFMIRLPIMRDAINQAHTVQEEEELSSLIHQMKGVGGGYGYHMLTELCAKIEFQIASQDLENVKALIEEFNLLVEQILEGHEENHKIAEQAES